METVKDLGHMGTEILMESKGCLCEGPQVPSCSHLSSAPITAPALRLSPPASPRSLPHVWGMSSKSAMSSRTGYHVL